MFQDWPIGKKNDVSKVVSKCIICFAPNSAFLSTSWLICQRNVLKIFRYWICPTRIYVGISFINWARNKALIKCYVMQQTKAQADLVGNFVGARNQLLELNCFFLTSEQDLLIAVDWGAGGENMYHPANFATILGFDELRT